MGMHIVDGVLMVQTPDDFGDESLLAIKRNVLDKVYSSSVRGVIVDVSTIRMLDSVGFQLLAEMVRAVALLGAKVLIVGLQPGVVSTLVDLNVDCDDILTALDVDDALAQLRPASPEPEPETDLDEEEAENGIQDEQTEGGTDDFGAATGECNSEESSWDEDE